MNKTTKFQIQPPSITDSDLSDPLTYPVTAFLSKEYLQEEKDKLWPLVWQHAGRVEEIPEVGNYITYEVADESILIVRHSETELKAFHNVCPHRGRRLVSNAPGCISACGKQKRFVCGFHGWTFDTEGKNVFILDDQDWKGALNEENTSLSPVKVDTWGGWIFINMDPDAIPLREYLEPAATILDPFEFDKMRYKWRQWVVFDCNWKTAIEAFMEPYHVHGTHSQLLKYGQYYAYSAPHGQHGVSGFDERDPAMKMKQSSSLTRAGKGGDPRVSTYELQREVFDNINKASSTQTLVDAASRLVDELPEGTSAQEVVRHWLASAKADDAARGVIWPEITPDQLGKAGLAWSIFPNMTILQGITFGLCYRVRPHGDNPDQCIFESYAIERFPPGEEPKTEWVQCEATAEKWGSVLVQDFNNMGEVQKGMKSRGFKGTLPNPHQEQKVTNFHRQLARYMGTGAPVKIKY